MCSEGILLNEELQDTNLVPQYAPAAPCTRAAQLTVKRCPTGPVEDTTTKHANQRKAQKSVPGSPQASRGALGNRAPRTATRTMYGGHDVHAQVFNKLAAQIVPEQTEAPTQSQRALSKPKRFSLFSLPFLFPPPLLLWSDHVRTRHAQL